MEATAPILARFGLRESPIVSQVQALTPYRPQTSASSPSLPVSLCAKNSARPLRLNPLSNLRPLKASSSSSSSSENGSADSAVRWVLEPIGDGDSRHIGYKVPMPGAFEIVSGAVIGRVPEKADLVLPVATVSGLHARLENKNGVLLVTDLDSTNGTYVDEKKLRPGAVTAVSPGSILIFGDIHLAMFRVSKLVSTVSGTPDEADKEEVKTETSTTNVEPTS